MHGMAGHTYIHVLCILVPTIPPSFYSSPLSPLTDTTSQTPPEGYIMGIVTLGALGDNLLQEA